MRFALIVLALIAAGPAAAQPSPEAARAARALGALWRPLSGEVTLAAITTACAGAREEAEQIAAAVPGDIGAATVNSVRAPAGLMIVPTEEDPTRAFLFPPASLSWFAGGLGAIRVVSEAEGRIVLSDAVGREIPLVIGRAGRHALLRLSVPDGPPLTFVGCARL